MVSEDKKMRLPPSLETLGKYAFGGCEGLKEVTLSPKMTAIEYNTFSFCSSLTSVEGMESIDSIGYDAFYKCSSLQSLTVKRGAHIGEEAFWNCNAEINYI